MLAKSFTCQYNIGLLDFVTIYIFIRYFYSITI